LLLDRSLSTIPNAISQAVGQISTRLNAAAIMTLTQSGSTARNVSKFRPTTPILAITPHVDVARQLQMVWGVKSLLVLSLPSTTETFQAAIQAAQDTGLLKGGDLVVTTAGTLQGVSGSTDLIKVEIVSAVLGQGTGIGLGRFSGIARIAKSARSLKEFSSGDILVASKTDASYLEYIQQAQAIVVEEDGITSHASVLGLQLGIPVIVGVKDATTLIRDGALLTLDVPQGMVYSGAIES
jgi:pyruvate kinase